MPPSKPREVLPPSEFRISRALGLGRHQLLKVFPGLDEAAGFQALFPSSAQRGRLVHECGIEVVKEPVWMYVAPHAPIPGAPRQWKPVITADDCGVVGREHLSKSPPMVVYLDILHEPYHLLQRSAGRELWEREYEYADRPTEIEAYRVLIAEGRRLGVTDAFLRDYLRVTWMSEREVRRLWKNVGVSAR